MRFIPYETRLGEENMRIDKELLESAIATKSSESILRLYGWEKPTLTLGRNQKESAINEDFCHQKDIAIVRRITGGRAVLHDKELTYCFITKASTLKNGESVVESYKEISQALILGLEQLKIKAEMFENKQISTKNPYCMAISSGADLCAHGKKLVGSAQCRKEGYILQHGSILIDADNEIVSKIFSTPLANDNIITIKQLNAPLAQDLDLICEKIRFGFEKKFSSYV